MKIVPFIPIKLNNQQLLGKMGISLDIRHIFYTCSVAARYAESHDVKIYNASRGGILETFKRVRFDELFE